MNRLPPASLYLCLASLASAVTLDVGWLGGSGSWDNAANWSTAGIPAGTDSVSIDPSPSGAVTVTISAPATAKNLTIGASDTVSIGNNQSLTLDAGGGTSLLTIGTDAKLSLNSVGNNTALVVQNGQLVVSGSGSIDLGNNAGNQIRGTSGTASLINQATIQGAGALGLDTLSLVNNGTIAALYSTPLILDPAALGSFINTGLLEAASGGLLRLNTGTIQNASGTILAQDSGTVQLTGVEIQSGTLSSTGTGTITVTGNASLSNGVSLTANSRLTLNNNVSLSFADTLLVAGTLALSSVGNTTDLIGSATTATLAGTGTIDLSNNTSNRIYSAASTGLIINQANIQGAGQIGANVGAFRNEGTISALYFNALTLDPGPGGFTNTGQLVTGVGGNLALKDGAFTNTGGTMTANRGTITLSGGATIVGGTLSSIGTGYFANYGSNVLDAVQLAPGTDYRLINSTALTLRNTLTNQGKISLFSLGSDTDLIIDSADVTLTGNGEIALSYVDANRIYGSVGTNRLTNLNNTIHGTGLIGVDQLVFTNQGTVAADLAESTLTLDPSAGGFSNSGTYRAANGGILVLSAGSFDNNGGTIEAAADSTVRISNATITGGSINVASSAGLEFNGATLIAADVTAAPDSVLQTTGGASTLGGSLDLAADATLRLGNNSALTLLASGAYAIDGTIALNSIGNITDLIVSGGDVTLHGEGSVLLDNNGSNRIYGADPTNRLVLAGVNLHGGGQLGVDLMGLVNQATITADDSTTLTINPSAAGVTNTGTLRADGGLLLLTDGTFDNTGGQVEAVSGSTVRFDNTQFTAGTFSGAGALQATGNNRFTDLHIEAGTTLSLLNNTSSVFAHTLENAGVIALGSVGNLTDFIAGAGDLTLTGGGEVQLGGNSSNRLAGASASVTLTNTDNLIRGAGQLGVNQLILNNQATIQADLAGQTLVIDVAGTGLTNSGLLLATNNATLNLQDSSISNQTGGRLRAESGATLAFNGVTLATGQLEGPGTLVANGSNTFTHLNLAANSTLSVTNNSSATFAGTLTNAGLIQLNSLGNLTNFIAGSDGLTLTGGGTITLGTNSANRIYGLTAATTLLNTDNTISGYGQVGANQLVLTNQAVITANVPGQTLLLDTSGLFTNTGSIRAENGGNLEISDSTVDNTGGSFDAATGSTVTLTGSTIKGGTLNGPINIGSATVLLDSVALATGTTVTVGNNRRLDLTGTIDNRGTVSVSSIGNLTDVVISATGAHLTGSGGVLELASAQTRLYGATGSTNLTLDAGQTIRGAGQLGANQLHLTQTGTIAATGTTPLVIDLSTSLTNLGTLSAIGAGGLQSNDAVINQGTVTVASGSKLAVAGQTYTQETGLTQLAGGKLSANSLLFAGGSLRGQGLLDGAASLQGVTLAPTGGTLDFDDSLTFSSDTLIELELAGTQAGFGYGSIAADSILLDGTLTVFFSPQLEQAILATDSFLLLSADSLLSGTFRNVPVGGRLLTSDGRGSFALNYDTLSVSLTDFQPIPEPSTWLLLLSGAGSLFLVHHCRRRPRGRG